MLALSFTEWLDRVSGILLAPGVVAVLGVIAKGATGYGRQIITRLDSIDATLRTHDDRIVDVTEKEIGHHKENGDKLDRIERRIDALAGRRG